MPHLAHIPGTCVSPQACSNAASNAGLQLPTALLCLAGGPGMCPMPMASVFGWPAPVPALCARLPPNGHPWGAPLASQHPQSPKRKTPLI